MSFITSQSSPKEESGKLQVGTPVVASQEQAAQPNDVVKTSISESALEFLSQAESELQQHGLSISGIAPRFLFRRNTNLNSHVEHEHTMGDSSKNAKASSIPQHGMLFDELSCSIMFSTTPCPSQDRNRAYNVSVSVRNHTEYVYANEARAPFQETKAHAWSPWYVPFLSRAADADAFKDVAYFWEYPEYAGGVQLFSFASQVRLLSLRISDVEKDVDENGKVREKLVLLAEFMFPPRMEVEYYYDSKEEVPYAKEKYLGENQRPQWMVVNVKMTLPFSVNEIINIYYQEAHRLRFRDSHGMPMYTEVRLQGETTAAVNGQGCLDTIYFAGINEATPAHIRETYRTLHGLKDHFKYLYKCKDSKGKSILQQPVDRTKNIVSLVKDSQKYCQNQDFQIAESIVGNSAFTPEDKNTRLKRIVIEEQSLLTWDANFNFPKNLHDGLKWLDNNMRLFRRVAKAENDNLMFSPKPFEIKYAHEQVKEHLQASEKMLNSVGLSYNDLNFSLEEVHRTAVETVVDCNQQDVKKLFSEPKPLSSWIRERAEKGLRDVMFKQGGDYNAKLDHLFGIRVELTDERGGFVEVRNENYQSYKQRILSQAVLSEALKTKGIQLPQLLTGKDDEKAKFLGVVEAKFDLYSKSMSKKKSSPPCAVLVLTLAFYAEDRGYGGCRFARQNDHNVWYASSSCNSEPAPQLFYSDVQIAVPPADHLIKVKQYLSSETNPTEVGHNNLLEGEIYTIAKTKFTVKKSNTGVSMNMRNTARAEQLILHNVSGNMRSSQLVPYGKVDTESGRILFSHEEQEFTSFYKDLTALNPDNNVVQASVTTSIDMNVNVTFKYASN